MSDAGDDRVWLYWEKQVSALCAVHAVNALLQGRHVDEVALATVAHALDAEEAAALDGHVPMMSHNVADDGNYSVQVILRALAGFGLQLTVLDHPRLAPLKEDPGADSEQLFAVAPRTAAGGVPPDAAGTDGAGGPLVVRAYVLWQSSHWFTVRAARLPDGSLAWFNLNSLNKDGPEYLSPFYMEAYFSSMRLRGFTIYAVEGTGPEPVPDAGLTVDGLRVWHRCAPHVGGGGGGGDAGAGTAAGAGRDALETSADDPVLQRILQESAAAAGVAVPGGSGGGLDASMSSVGSGGDDLAAAIALSLQEGNAQGGSDSAPAAPAAGDDNAAGGGGGDDDDDSDDDSDDLAAAMALSMQQPGAPVPASADPVAVTVDETQPTTTLQLRLADGSQQRAVFNHQKHTVADIRRLLGGDSSSYTLVCPIPPRRTFDGAADDALTLEAAGLVNCVVIQQRRE